MNGGHCNIKLVAVVEVVEIVKSVTAQKVST
jgi:hypothetical protein